MDDKIEDIIFNRMRVNMERLVSYGFMPIRIDMKTSREMEYTESYIYKTELLGGDFLAEITVNADGKLCGRVIDVMNDEEFDQLRNDSYNGSFVNSVRSEYEELLRDIAENCFELANTKKKSKGMDETFVRRVLEVADSIPKGKVASYGQIADLVDKPKNARMVGRIMSMADRYGNNPCHRVVNSSGRTVPGWDEQRRILEDEGVVFKSNGCVDMEKCRWKTK